MYTLATWTMSYDTQGSGTFACQWKKIISHQNLVYMTNVSIYYKCP